MTHIRRTDRAVSDRQEIMQILNQLSVCRLAMRDAEGIYLVPMNFGYEWPKDGVLTLYFHCAPEGRRVRALREDPQVAFEMDQEIQLIGGDAACSYGCLYQSIIGQGTAYFLEDSDEKSHALALLMKHQTGKDFVFTPAMTEAVTVFKVCASHFSAKARRK